MAVGKNMCKLTIIVPVYNTEKYVGRCLDALMSSEISGSEILCIDDGSTDSSYDILERYADMDSRIKLIHQENHGLPSVRNIGLAASNGKYISFVDSDDWVDCSMIKAFVEYMELNEDIDICVGDAVREFADGSSVPMFKAKNECIMSSKEALYEFILGEKCFWYMWGKVYRKSVFDGFMADENVTTCEDFDSMWQLFSTERIRNVLYSPIGYYHYFFNPLGMTEGRKVLERCKSDLYVFQKILHGSFRRNDSMIMDMIRFREVQSLYNLSKEQYFTNSAFDDIKKNVEVIKEEISKIEYKPKSVLLKRMSDVGCDVNLLKAFFDKVYGSILKVIMKSKDFSLKYIYGVGNVAHYVAGMMKEHGGFDGFVVSDDQPNPLNFEGNQVIRFSEIPFGEKVAVILAMNENHQKEVLKNLRRHSDLSILVPNIPEGF